MVVDPIKVQKVVAEFLAKRKALSGVPFSENEMFGVLAITHKMNLAEKKQAIALIQKTNKNRWSFPSKP